MSVFLSVWSDALEIYLILIFVFCNDKNIKSLRERFFAIGSHGNDQWWNWPLNICSNIFSDSSNRWVDKVEISSYLHVLSVEITNILQHSSFVNVGIAIECRNYKDYTAFGSQTFWNCKDSQLESRNCFSTSVENDLISTLKLWRLFVI